MQNTVTLTLAGLCLGIAMSGLFAVLAGRGERRARLCLGIVYVAFSVIVAVPLIWSGAPSIYPAYMPLVLVMLLALPPAIYHYVVAKTQRAPDTRIPWRDLAMPLAGVVACIGFWVLPAEDKATMFIVGDLPDGFLPSAVALLTFVLLMAWLAVSFVYLLAILRRLTAYRAHIRQLYSNIDQRDLRWVDWVMALLVLIWVAGAVSLADENLAQGDLFVREVLFALTACCLLVLNIFAARTPTDPDNDPDPDPEPDLPTESADIKYARSALTPDHAAKLAKRIEDAMRKDTLYFDPNLSLQKLSRHVGALPNQVSQTLNQEIGANFFDYVAHWRIKASEPLILAGDASVLDVAMDVGFNSKSTFYKAFKRETGETPKSYRQNAHAGGRVN